MMSVACARAGGLSLWTNLEHDERGQALLRRLEELYRLRRQVRVVGAEHEHVTRIWCALKRGALACEQPNAQG